MQNRKITITIEDGVVVVSMDNLSRAETLALLHQATDVLVLEELDKVGVLALKKEPSR